ncbi:MAG: PadR family transcriptional regulator [Cyanobacteria bacterium SIG26]|nr:PadR family transcriptional regulator [Cyanobacteria bacterium SIG26]
MIDLMILYILLKHDLTMYAIHKRIGEYFLAYTNPSFGALKPALVRLEKKGCITTSKIMSDGGKLSVFYSITKDGMKELKELLLKPFSTNALQFFSDARVKLSCASFLSGEDAAQMYLDIKSNAVLHKNNAEKILADDYTPQDFYQRIVLDNAICEYKNFISMVEGLEKENARNSR